MTRGGWFLLEVTLHGAWQLAERVRNTVRSGLMIILVEDEAEMVGMVVSELLENALKYGDFSERHPPEASRLLLSGTATEVEISLEHPVPAGSPHLPRLLATLARLEEAEDLEAAYIETLQQVAVRVGGEGGLGLARVSYEGRCRVRAEQLADGRLRLWTRIQPKQEPQAVSTG